VYTERNLVLTSGLASEALSQQKGGGFVPQPPRPDTTSDLNSTPQPFGQDERARVIAILRDFGVQHASVFGSGARGEQRPDSDLDLLVDLPPGASLLDLSRLGLALEDALGRPVDLVTSFADLHPVIQERIQREAEVLL
jgi:predicted nucleotidyltransferase